MTPSRTLRACFRRPVRLFNSSFLKTKEDKMIVSARTFVFLLALILIPVEAALSGGPACCLPDGTCENNPVSCPGTSLADRVCSDVQACRLGQECVDMDAACCEDAGGTPLLVSRCADFVSCCESDACQILNANSCLQQGGTPILAECENRERPCCFPSGTPGGTCQTLNPVCCTARGGKPLYGTNVDLESCDAVTCCLHPDVGEESKCDVRDPCSCVVTAGGLPTPGTCDSGTSSCCGAFCSDPYFGGSAPTQFSNNVQQLCASFTGFPLPPNLIPPPNPVCSSPPPNLPHPDLCGTFPRYDEAYMARLTEFLRDGQYRNLGWTHDAYLRETGSYEGIPPGGTTFSTHHVVKIYYSPEIIEWRCRGIPSNCENGPCAEDGGEGICTGPCTTSADCPANETCADGACKCTSNSDCPAGETCNLGDGLCVLPCTADSDCSASQTCSFGFCACQLDTDCPAGDVCDVMLPAGAMLVKEMWPTRSIGVDPDDGKMWIDESCYNESPEGWAVMVKGHDGSHDDWFWILLGSQFDLGAPPIMGSSAVTATDFFDYPTHQLLIDHSATRYPTGQQHTTSFCSAGALSPGSACTTDANCPGGTCVPKKQGSVVDPNYGFNMRQDCLACHASAKQQSTFTSLNNILGGGINPTTYKYCTPLSAQAGMPCANSTPGGGGCPDIQCGPGVVSTHGGTDVDLTRHNYASPLSAPDPEFLALFTQFTADAPSIKNVLDSRFPAESYDHVVSTTGGLSLATPNKEQFLTSDQCIGCHDATSLLSVTPNMAKCVVVDCITDQDCVESGCGVGAVCNVNKKECEVCGDDLICEPCVEQINLSPYGEWRVSPMGLAGRDPIFFSLLQTETNLSPSLKDCIETFCLNCHGVMGRRQIGIDNPAATPQCANILDPEFGPESFPQLFTRDQLNDWPGRDPNDLATLEAAKYGGLGRDGVSCTVCHHMDTLSSPLPPNMLTGNFPVGPPNEIFGPYDNDVAGKAMKNSLGITPSGKPQIQEPGLCGTCHVIRVPVFDPLVNGTIPLACLDTTELGNPTVGSGIEAIAACVPPKMDGDPCSVGPESGTCKPYFTFEQTTYLEFLNSEFNEKNNQPDTFKSCQDCHMPRKFDGDDLAFKIANIQIKAGPDSDWPFNVNAGIGQIDTRAPFGRHFLYGLNVFLNEMAQQFPLILGLRQIDAMADDQITKPALLTAREAVLKFAEKETASIMVGPATLEAGPQPGMVTLKADVTVTNKTGHKLSTGVGFRRLFIEFLVCDTASGDDCSCDNGALWGSGCTNSLGVIINGTNGPTLASEFSCDENSPSPPCPNPPTGQGCPAQQGPDDQCYQPHYGAPGIFEHISKEDQVQIYGERVADCDGKFTGSVTHLCDEVKDNRLLPNGWKSDGPYALVTGPGPGAILDHLDYPTDGTPASGSDTVSYEISLTEAQALLVKSVRATLYFQAIPPGFLNERFNSAFVGAREKTDIERLYYITSRLSVDAENDANEEFIKDWKLTIDAAATATIVAGACCVGTTCSVGTQADCAAQNGVYQGDGTACLLGTCPATGACCDDTTGVCTEDVTQADCEGTSRRYGGDGSTCDTIVPPCESPFIPTVSEWGLVVLTLVLLVGAKLYFGRREAKATH